MLYVADGNRTLWAVDPATGRTHYKNDGLAAKGAGIPVRFAKVGRDALRRHRTRRGRRRARLRRGDRCAARWTFNDGSGDIKQWRVAADGEHVYALHGPKLHALPAA